MLLLKPLVVADSAGAACVFVSCSQMLMTPRTSAADCESLMRAAMSECSVGSMALRSQPAVSGVPSLPSNAVSLGNSTNGALAARRPASGTMIAADVGTEAQGRAGGPAGASRQQQARQRRGDSSSRSRSRSRSAPRSAEGVQGDANSAGVSTEPSEVRADNSKVGGWACATQGHEASCIAPVHVPMAAPCVCTSTVRVACQHWQTQL